MELPGGAGVLEML